MIFLISKKMMGNKLGSISYREDRWGIINLIGSKDATHMAFKNGLIEQGEVWMNMIEARNKTTRTYDLEVAQAVADDILKRFYPAFECMTKKFTPLHDKEEQNP